MDVVDVLRELVVAAETVWMKSPEGERKEVMRELSDTLRQAAEAKLQARQPEGATPEQMMVAHVVEDPSEF